MNISTSITYRVCARRPCWRSKTIKFFSFGKKFNSHAKIFLLFTPPPPTWPPRTDSIGLKCSTASSLSFSSDLVREVNARASVERRRREKRGRRAWTFACLARFAHGQASVAVDGFDFVLFNGD